ncbi:CBS domain-containing protein [Pontivivens insulae]|uniref:Inosine-5'-monophosphate dehydrogenase n=1 Tax=Pontivivens insulae TaxID=1639689 RepID=A0A2R8ABX9_9RHOB|nr:CBS domain-containing protein [Pontivivens insulae]RED11114.1 CBS domain protein [Pontivivens insulae]SPF29711.1 Inosine-5'-monophosphate dehydrogenase [Pontivivens insulae]
MTVQKILNSARGAVETISGDASVLEAAQRLSARKIGALIVSEDGSELRGIVSERDIVREIGARGAAALSDKVVDLMTAKVESCAPDDKLVETLARMTAGRFRHMPVLEDGKLAGIISIGDVVKVRLSEMEHENSALADMIRGY